MRVIICGSRIINGHNGMSHVMDAIQACPFEITEVITGSADGVDSLADAWAKEGGIDRVVFPANWKGKKKAAGYKRNQKMAWYAGLFDNHTGLYGDLNSTDGTKGIEELPDRFKGACLAVWDGKSVGTKHMIDISEEAGLPVYIHLVKDIVKKKPGRKPKTTSVTS
jgi:hypothetical protein